MRICITDEEIKSCNQTTEFCNHCIPNHTYSVERLSASDLVEVAGKSTDHIAELQNIGHALEDFSKRKGISKANHDYIWSLLIRQYNVLAGMLFTGSTVYFNLLFSNLVDQDVAEEKTALILGLPN